MNPKVIYPYKLRIYIHFQIKERFDEKTVHDVILILCCFVYPCILFRKQTEKDLLKQTMNKPYTNLCCYISTQKRVGANPAHFYFILNCRCFG